MDTLDRRMRQSYSMGREQSRRWLRCARKAQKGSPSPDDDEDDDDWVDDAGRNDDDHDDGYDDNKGKHEIFFLKMKMLFAIGDNTDSDVICFNGYH